MTIVAAIQMISSPEVDDNLAEADRLIAEAVAQGARLVALPEYFPLIGATDAARLAACEDDSESMTEADGVGQPLQRFLAETARRHAIWLIGGSIPLVASDPACLRNSCLVYAPNGRRVARYDKIHLFSFQRGSESYDERLTIEAGDTVTTFPLEGLSGLRRAGLAICYDLRFPELFRAMGEVDLLVIPSAFTETTGRAHWELLLRARAVENQCYVLAAAQGGQHPTGRLTHGNSMLVDPWGEIVARIDKGPGVVFGKVDAQRLIDVRSSLPALQHRRF
jgi:nitrilase